MKKGDKVVCIVQIKQSDCEMGMNIPEKDEVYTVDQSCPCGCGNISLLELNQNEGWCTDQFRKVEPQTNALSKELAAKVIWEEMIKNPAIQEKELNPKVFKTNQKF